MKLRTRLFVWVGTLFFVVFVLSYFVEEYETKAQLVQAEKQIENQIKEANEKKRVAIEKYLSSILGKTQAQMDALLGRIAKYKSVRSGFSPNDRNYKNFSWMDSTSLLITNQWISYIQNVNQDHLSSMIMLDQKSIRDMLYFPIKDEFMFVGISDMHPSKNWKGPFIGVKFEIDVYQGRSLFKVSNLVQDENLSFFVLFTPEDLQKFDVETLKSQTISLSVDLLEPFLKWVAFEGNINFLDPFFKNIKEAQNALKAGDFHIPSQKEWSEWVSSGLKKAQAKTPQHEIELQTKRQTEYGSVFSEVAKSYLDTFNHRYDEIGMVWGLSALFASKAFGANVFHPPAPFGIARVEKNSHLGLAVYVKDVFYDKPQLSLASCLTQQEKDLEEVCSSSSMIVIHPPSKPNDLFFGSNLRMTDQIDHSNRIGYLTVGIHADEILKPLARATHEMTLFISGGEVLEALDRDGKRIDFKEKISIETIMNNSAGFLDIDGTEYYFLHMHPFKNKDFHFVTLLTKKEAFAFVDSARKSSQKLIGRISLEMRLAALAGLIVVLLFLNNISKKITQPISHLAQVTKHVGEGHLEDIEIPKKFPKRKDEVYTLYQSFFEMVKGLKEKEKVRGILNKVVSKEVAEETIKGNIHLGGEETKVTVMFGDIRHFTSMTENMPPQEVIQFINTCMTKISTIIDEYGGIIDKYVGDEVMALYGAPIPRDDCTVNAIKTALKTIEVLTTWNEERQKQNLPAVSMGFGIHYGNVVAGNMGAENRLNYTVLGANVNLASRLCSVAKEMEILVTEDVLHAKGVSEAFSHEEKEPIELKGFSQPIKIFKITAAKNSGNQ